MFELSRNFTFLTNAWNEVKITAKTKSGAIFAQSSRRKFGIDSKKVETNREMGRRYIQPTVNNR
jgi:hypothetical protein